MEFQIGERVRIKGPGQMFGKIGTIIERISPFNKEPILIVDFPDDKLTFSFSSKEVKKL